MPIDLIYTGIIQGLVLALVAYGVMIPFRILNFPDLTAEGAYTLGGVVCAILLINGMNPILAMITALICCGLAGICTSLISLYLKVNSLLSGIIVSTMLYSINLKILEKPNVALFQYPKIFIDNMNQYAQFINILILCAIIAGLIIPLALFLKTEFGLRMRAVGLNPDFAKHQGISITKYTVLGLFIGNCYTGLGGALMVQLQSYADIGMGIGIVIHALAALMIGEAIMGSFMKNKRTTNAESNSSSGILSANLTLNKQLAAPLIGAFVYQQIQGLALSFGLSTSDLKLLTGAIILLIIGTQKIQKRGVG